MEEVPTTVRVEVAVPLVFAVREGYAGPGRGAWVARHDAPPRIEVRASTRARALSALGSAVRAALARLLGDAAR